MKIVSFFLSIFLIIIYGYLFFRLFGPIDVNDNVTPNEQMFDEYDYIVVGAGSAGSVVASRLAEQNFKVLLLEAGVSDYIDIITMPIGIVSILSDLNYNYLKWGYKALLIKDQVQNVVDMARGKVVGGCGSINANVWNKGSHNIYDKWEKLGAKDWNYENIKQYFDKAENTLWIDRGDRFDLFIKYQEILFMKHPKLLVAPRA